MINILVDSRGLSALYWYSITDGVIGNTGKVADDGKSWPQTRFSNGAQCLSLHGERVDKMSLVRFVVTLLPLCI